MAKYIIGTRGSLLAQTQCQWVQKKLIALSSDDFELKIIKTQGDQVTDKALWQLEGKDFFTKELDDALIKREVDLVVHSYKDLGSVRPSQINLAAITKREIPNDILLIKKTSVQLLVQNQWTNDQFIIGTSSPRRITNVKNYLYNLLPHGNQLKSKITTDILRGNINTRIEKLIAGNYDAIVLAYAGLERLAMDPKSQMILEHLTKDLDFMILPCSYLPPAAAQGALAIECHSSRNDDKKLQQIISKLHCQETAELISIERKMFHDFGGGCHLAVGIHAKKIGPLTAIYQKGEVNNQFINHKDVINNQQPSFNLKTINHPGELFVGMRSSQFSPEHLYDEVIHKNYLETILEKDNCHYVTSQYCIEAIEKNFKPIDLNIIATAGVHTTKKLASKGYWIRFSSDSAGDEELRSYLDSKLLNNVFKLNPNWITLSHQFSDQMFPSKIGPVKACYRHEITTISQEYEQKLLQVKFFFWSSFTQYQYFNTLFPWLAQKHKNNECLFLCGAGKTYKQFTQAGVNIMATTTEHIINSLYKSET